jgi:hypothetical protein
MQTASFRSIVLIGVLLAGAGLYRVLGEPQGVGTPRWPESDALYAVDGWSVGPEQKVDGGFVARAFRTQAGLTATLWIFSNQAPKLYGAGAEVPFLGNGYSVVSEPTELVRTGTDGVNSLLARQGSEQWLVKYAFGERRGLLGNGPRAWSFAFLDGILGRPNDYYKMFIWVRVDRPDAELGRKVDDLATTLFTRIANFYAN